RRRRTRPRRRADAFARGGEDARALAVSASRRAARPTSAASAASAEGDDARGARGGDRSAAPLRLLAAASAALLVARLFAAGRVGFGDSVALYACWAMHPQPAYLDDPGLAGILARAIG